MCNELPVTSETNSFVLRWVIYLFGLIDFRLVDCFLGGGLFFFFFFFFLGGGILLLFFGRTFLV